VCHGKPQLSFHRKCFVITHRRLHALRLLLACPYRTARIFFNGKVKVFGKTRFCEHLSLAVQQGIKPIVQAFAAFHEIQIPKKVSGKTRFCGHFLFAAFS
jgi:hypothetical protein